MIFIYKIFSFLIYLAVYPYARLKAATGDPLWKGRLVLNNDIGQKNIWLHAASVGEVKIIGLLVEYLLEKNPSLSIFLTTMTRTGYKTALATLGNKVALAYLPIDTPPLMRKLLKNLRPDMLVIAETEIWPNLVLEASRCNLPIILINGRMSARAFNKYKWLRPFFVKLLARYERFFFKTEDDLKRYLYFGVAPEKTVCAGDMKFDAPVPDRSEVKIRQNREKIGFKREDFLLVAGSTRPGEEEMLMEIFKNLKKRHEKLVLAVAPRHLERIEDIKALLERNGFGYNIYDGLSLTGQVPPGADNKRKSLVLINRMGLLNELYLAADLAFVGGTLVPIGGHNLLEPVWAGTPVLFGPSLDNVMEAADYIINGNFGARADSASELEKIIEQVLRGEKKFAVKSTKDMQRSVTAKVGCYLLERIEHG